MTEVPDQGSPKEKKGKTANDTVIKGMILPRNKCN